mgnify:CR=1 FL=1
MKRKLMTLLLSLALVVTMMPAMTMTVNAANISNINLKGQYFGENWVGQRPSDLYDYVKYYFGDSNYYFNEDLTEISFKYKDNSGTYQDFGNTEKFVKGVEYRCDITGHPALDYYFEPAVTPTDEYYSTQLQHSMNQVGDIESVWDDYTGEGTTVAIIDTGINYMHPDFYRDPNDYTTCKISSKS